MHNRIIGVTLALLAPLTAAHAQTSNTIPLTVVSMVDASGDVAKKTGNAGFVPMKLPLRRSTVLLGLDTIRTGSDSAALIAFDGTGYLRIGANSTVTIFYDGGSLSFKILAGQAWALFGKGGVCLNTPSANVYAKANALVGVGYDPPFDSSVVSVDGGRATVLLSLGDSNVTASAGQFVQYLRNPQPNMRLRAPQIDTQPKAHKTMWKRLRAEPWTQGKPGKLARGIETSLQVLVPVKTAQTKGGKP